MRFLLSRRWLVFAVVVTLLAYGCYWLGEWQFHRLEERRARNVVTERNLVAEPLPVEDVLAVGEPVEAEDEWRRVRARGAYVDAATVVVRYRTRDGVSGVDAVTPLRLEGTDHLLLVDRGWVGTDNQGDATADVPAPPAGTVTVVGWVRADATGDSTTVDSGSTRAVSSRTIGPTLEGEVLGGFVDLVSETPRPEEPLVAAERPDLGSGPHFFYGLQWWFFAALAIFGFGYLAWDERRKQCPPQRTPTAGRRPTA